MLTGFQFDLVVAAILVAVALIVLIVTFARKTITRARRNALIRSNRRAHQAKLDAEKNKTNRMWNMLDKQ